VHPLLVWEHPYYPVYFVPRADVRARLLEAGPGSAHEGLGTSVVYDVWVGSSKADAAARTHPASPIPALRDAVRFQWDALDEWLEEDEPVYTHARDPYLRVDILASSRHVTVMLGSTLLADSRQPRLLFETGLPPRFYLPLPDVRLGLLRPSPTVTSCPYKGTATYWSAEIAGTVHEDLVWMYRTPLPESQKVAGLFCFYTERVQLEVDGVHQGVEPA
jgi:uncharacterized protein (DUF427 family)